MIRFAREDLWAVASEILPLWHRHYEEGAEDREAVPFDPDWERYGALNDLGRLIVITARTEADEMVGYLMAILDHHLHSRTTLFASVDLYWLAPEHRGGRTALRFLRFAEGAFREAGAVVVLQHAWHVGGQERLLVHLGYRPIETVMKKVI
ncbi:hypothetical protein [Methylobacterium sp. yr596]|uniref:hypothetical protein n=1 Tax=Methylobacterium sp. yr596 TaxID=1761800 RepID=UPI0008EB3816|nr:hypothetical protein [Methylobacterium sp. yr596]SFF76710.1 hypothetical protein SAMN04487844_14710 [Methylobacterium sp. yr596]